MPRLTTKQAKKLGIKSQATNGRSKYNVGPKEGRTWNGVVYDSKGEMECAQWLDTFMGKEFFDFGVLSRWGRQYKLPVGPDESFKVDFGVVFGNWPPLEAPDVYVEFKGNWKGRENRDFRRKLRLWEKYRSETMLVVQKERRGGRMYVAKTVQGGAK